jgi:hypothetical protein
MAVLNLETSHGMIKVSTMFCTDGGGDGVDIYDEDGTFIGDSFELYTRLDEDDDEDEIAEYVAKLEVWLDENN